MNFLSPYTACNVSDFWRRWHVSLTQWFRDYIYFALGGSRTRFWMVNIVVMFLISGVWHGAGWNFIIWGLLAGVTMVIHRCFKNSNMRIPSFISWGLTFAVMVFIWMFFYETNMEIVMKNLRVVSTLSCYDVADFIRFVENNRFSSASWLVFLPASFFVIALEYISQKTHREPYQIFLSFRTCAIMVILICVLHCEKTTEFIYFAF